LDVHIGDVACIYALLSFFLCFPKAHMEAVFWAISWRRSSSHGSTPYLLNRVPTPETRVRGFQCFAGGGPKYPRVLVHVARHERRVVEFRAVVHVELALPGQALANVKSSRVSPLGVCVCEKGGGTEVARRESSRQGCLVQFGSGRGGAEGVCVGKEQCTAAAFEGGRRRG